MGVKKDLPPVEKLPLILKRLDAAVLEKFNGSYADAGKAIGEDRGTLWKMLTGKRESISMRVYWKLIQACGISEESLYTPDDETVAVAETLRTLHPLQRTAVNAMLNTFGVSPLPAVKTPPPPVPAEPALVEQLSTEENDALFECALNLAHVWPAESPLGQALLKLGQHLKMKALSKTSENVSEHEFDRNTKANRAIGAS